ncbi:MAG: CPBP family intramembrane metalloprotease, partial [Clostridia bacterium]|nr:CPBP family intramembrane metalloprotease [Clostridia bacterium]
LAILLQFGLFSFAELNTAFLEWLHQAFGYESSPILLPSVSGKKIVGVLLAVAMLPAITEELFFRGVFMQGLKQYGRVFSVLVCGGLFALYHQNPAQTAYQFCCGAAFALIAYQSGSIFPTLVSHFLNNTAVIILYAIGLDEFSTAFKIPFLICSAVCLVGSLAYLIAFDKKQETERVEKPKKKDFFLFAFVGILLFAISWLSTFLSGV